ncbi:MAG: hypothetical protein R3240_00180 [Gammaproteobacteria bacterium]|nr:hypothetical protein [Gammaproteobacteria bacterium]
MRLALMFGGCCSILLFSCAENRSAQPQQILHKPATYLPGGNLFSLISPAGVDVTQPWNAKDSSLINTIRSRAIDTVSTDAITETVTACSDGGNTRSIVDNQGPPWFSEGDVFTTVFEDCVQGNTLITGQRSYSVDVMQGQQFIDPEWSLTTAIDRDIVNTNLVTDSINANKGTARTEVAVTNTTQYSQILSGNYESSRPNNGVQVDDTAEYMVTYQWDEAPDGFYTWNFELTTTSTNPVFPEKTVTKTLETLTAPNNQAPESGKIETSQTKDGTTQITTITATGNAAVLVEVDVDGDGVVDSTSESTWQEVVLDPFLYQFF